MKSSLLIVGDSNLPKLKIPTEKVLDLSRVKKWNHSVYVLNPQSTKQSTTWIKKIKSETPDAPIVLVGEPFSIEDLQFYKEWNHLYFSDSSKMVLAETVDLALSRRQKKPQSKQKTAHKKQTTLNLRMDALHKALTAVQSAQSITEIESQLLSILAESFHLSWVRIFLFANEHLDSQLSRIKGQKIFKTPLVFSDRQLGQLVVARTDNKMFSKSEQESMNQISASAALALDRLAKKEQAETLHLEWESTFDAITEPLCLTDEKFRMIRTNKAFLATTQLKAPQTLGLNCFMAFCNVEAPTQVEPSGRALILQRVDSADNESQFFEVTTQRVQIPQNPQSILLVLFRNITEQKKIEKQIFESSKLAELGTISSSIAHDINNPLGGMINFIQLLKMEIQKGHPYYEDLIAMETAGQRCKEIVENLLRFSRRQEMGAERKTNLLEALQQALSVLDLQARPLGIHIELIAPSDNYTLNGHLNLLAQALSHILQNAFDAVSEKLASSPGYNGLITLELEKSAHQMILTIFDNGVGISLENQNKILNPLFSTKNKKQGLGLTLAYQIIADHGGRLEIFSQPNVGTTVKISFQNV